MNYEIRKIRENEYRVLNDFIYEAIFIPEGVAPPPKSIIEQPDLQVYVRDFGTEKDDICFVAEADNRIVGAVWVRDMPDYGHIEDGVPSFAISLYKEYRNFGIGTALMKTMLDELRRRGYDRASLAVQKANYAVRMYKKAGFEIVDLIGKDINIIQVDIQRRICDALKQDDRITDIKDFSFEVQKNKLIAYFTVETIFGSYEMQDEFTV